MDMKDCPCRKKKCERHGKCDECRAFHNDSKRKLRVACDRSHNKTVYVELLIIVALICAIQCLFLAVKQIVFIYIEETLFSRSMVTLTSMIVLLAALLSYAGQKHYSLSAFPRKFGVSYI